MTFSGASGVKPPLDVATKIDTSPLPPLATTKSAPPIARQIGGGDPKRLAAGRQLADERGHAVGIDCIERNRIVAEIDRRDEQLPGRFHDREAAGRARRIDDPRRAERSRIGRLSGANENLPRLVQDDRIGRAVAGDIRERRGRADGIAELIRRDELAIALAEQHRNGPIGTIGACQIQAAVAIHVGGDDCRGRLPDGIHDRRSERQRAPAADPADEDADAIVSGIRRGQIEPAVAIEIPRGDPARL